MVMTAESVWPVESVTVTVAVLEPTLETEPDKTPVEAPKLNPEGNAVEL
jgi:hypothetical protein